MKGSSEEHIRRANQLYDEGMKGELESRFRGQTVAIHVESGDYFLGHDALEACDKGREKYPGAVFVCRRVGDEPLYRVGAF